MTGVQVFKIQNQLGEFSSGGSPMHWSSKGKAWTSIGALRSHVTLVTEAWARSASGHPGPHPYEQATIRTFVLVMSDESQPVDVRRVVDKLVEKERARQDRLARWSKRPRESFDEVSRYDLAMLESWTGGD